MNDIYAQQVIHRLDAIYHTLEKIAGELAALREQNAGANAKESEALKVSQSFVDSFKEEPPKG